MCGDNFPKINHDSSESCILSRSLGDQPLSPGHQLRGHRQGALVLLADLLQNGTWTKPKKGWIYIIYMYICIWSNYNISGSLGRISLFQTEIW